MTRRGDNGPETAGSPTTTGKSKNKSKGLTPLGGFDEEWSNESIGSVLAKSESVNANTKHADFKPEHIHNDIDTYILGQVTLLNCRLTHEDCSQLFHDLCLKKLFTAFGIPPAL